MPRNSKNNKRTFENSQLAILSMERGNGNGNSRRSFGNGKPVDRLENGSWQVEGHPPVANAEAALAQSLELDYCFVHGVLDLDEDGFCPSCPGTAEELAVAYLSYYDTEVVSEEEEI